MQFYKTAFVLFFGLALPVFASASVVINEIAWMGTADSSTNEWIELANTGGASVDISGFALVAEDGTPSVTLSGSIASGGYYLIERTDDTTVPGISADLVASFGGGLSNGGETLRLKDMSGNVIDTVFGGTDWANIGGDNVTKETAQRSGNGWITRPGTPRAINSGAEAVVTPPTATTTSLGASNDDASNTSSPAASPAWGGVWEAPPSKYPRANITVLAGKDRNAFVGFPVEFSGHALGLYDESLPYATYRWNWGDGSTGIGATTTHIYVHPGEYVVTVMAINGQFRDRIRLNVLVSVPEITIEKVIPGNAGAVFLRNASSHEIDLSGWVLREDGGGVFTVPEYTFILSGKTLVLGNEVTSLAYSGERKIVLAYPSGVQVATTEPARTPTKEHSSVSVTKQAASVSSPKKGQEDNAVLERDQALGPSSTPMTAATVLWDGGRDVKQEGLASGGAKWWVLVCAAVLLVLACMVALKNSAESSPSNEYTIIEEIDDGKE